MICSAQAYCAAVYAANPLHSILQHWIKVTKACVALAKTSGDEICLLDLKTVNTMEGVFVV